MQEDDKTISAAIEKSLLSWGFEAHAVTDFSAVLEEFVNYNPQLVLMDISLPFFNGYYWCAEIRKISKVPILFISSSSDNMNIVMAVNMGGDDFIPKPFDIDVLLAKVRAALRRTYDFSGETSVIEASGAILDKNDTTLLFGGKKTELTKNEYRILEVLITSKGRVVSRDSLMNSLWETDSFVDDNTLTVNITRLRKKLEETGLPDLIKTKKGLGYIIED